MDDRTPEQKIIDKVKGAIAEELFIQLHTEKGCLVYRTGTEFLYPNLYPISKLKKQLYKEIHHEESLDQATEAMAITASLVKKDIDQENFKIFLRKSDLGKRIERDMRKAHFGKQETEEEIHSTPDFTIVTPSGIVAQFEVKYRCDGVLSDQELERICKYHPQTNVFVFMDEEPYINIYSPGDIDLADEDTRGKILEYTIKAVSGHEFTKEEKAVYDLAFEKAKLAPKKRVLMNNKDQDQLHLEDGRKLGFTDEQIVFSYDLLDPGMARGASMFKISYNMMELKSYGNILRSVMGPLKALWRKT